MRVKFFAGGEFRLFDADLLQNDNAQDLFGCLQFDAQCCPALFLVPCFSLQIPNPVSPSRLILRPSYRATVFAELPYSHDFAVKKSCKRSLKLT